MLENIEREYLKKKKTMDVSAILFTFQSISLEANEPNVRSARTLRLRVASFSLVTVGYGAPKRNIIDHISFRKLHFDCATEIMVESILIL